jgi:GNAT superfamily N-acetyltransferase
MEIHAENYRFYPLTMEKWSDFESLFGPRGASGGCWCMYWRVPRREFTKGQGEPFRQAMRGLVEAGTVPGLLAYDGRDAVGWISIGKREEFILLKQSRVLAPVDDEPVWSIVCFYIAKAYREKGLMLPLINAAVEYAAEHRAKIVEAYPMDHAGL